MSSDTPETYLVYTALRTHTYKYTYVYVYLYMCVLSTRQKNIYTLGYYIGQYHSLYPTISLEIVQKVKIMTKGF